MRNSKLIVITRRLLTPDKIPGINIAAWFDTMESGSVILDGTTASQWSDISGNNRHLTQATKANQPTYIPDGLNGKPVLAFNGAQRMAASFSVAAPYESWFVLRVNGAPSTYIFRDGVDETANRVSMLVSNNNITITTENSTALTTGTGFLFPYGSPLIVGGLYNGSSSSISVNGTVEATGTAGTVTTNGLTIGGRFNGATFNLNGFYAEHILTNGVLSTPHRQQFEGYLAWRRGLQANLAGNHPFKFSPPYI